MRLPTSKDILWNFVWFFSSVKSLKGYGISIKQKDNPPFTNKKL